MDNGNGKRKSQVPIWQKNLQSRQVPQKPTNAERTVRTWSSVKISDSKFLNNS